MSDFPSSIADLMVKADANATAQAWENFDKMMEIGTFKMNKPLRFENGEPVQTLRAVGQKVFIRPDKVEEKTLTGIFLTPSYQPPPCSGVVVACGPGRYNRKGIFIPTDLKPGDRVSFRWIDAEQINSTVKWNGEELKVLNADELVGLVEKE